MVIAYALAVVSRARASKILLAGFDGYPSGDPRNQEMNEVLETYQVMDHALPLFAITPSKYKIHQNSIFSMI
jgi:4-hydroxy 2-oxovalerate aldolase